MKAVFHYSNQLPAGPASVSYYSTKSKNGCGSPVPADKLEGSTIMMFFQWAQPFVLFILLRKKTGSTVIEQIIENHTDAPSGHWPQRTYINLASNKPY
jgi:hypothetical protein